MEDKEGETSLHRVFSKSSSPPTKPVTPDATAGEGMISLMYRFLYTQEQRVERYQRELEGLHDSILLTIHPAETLPRIRIRMSFIARYVYTYEEFVFVTEAAAVQQNDSDRTKT